MMWRFPKIVILNQDLIDEIKALRYSDESFSKFEDPTHPAYPDYKDRVFEKWHDLGHNNAIESVLQVISARFL